MTAKNVNAVDAAIRVLLDFGSRPGLTMRGPRYGSLSAKETAAPVIPARNR